MAGSPEVGWEDSIARLKSNGPIWVPDVQMGWKRAKLLQLQRGEDRITAEYQDEESGQIVCAEYGMKEWQSGHFLCPRNITLGEDRIDDLTGLSFLNEASVLNAIRTRYGEGNIYTYSGLVLASVNPYCRLPLYENELIWAYSGRRKGELAPHLFAIAEEAYRSMCQDKQNQSIVISGESGAGKTISAKYIMRYFAKVCALGAPILQSPFEVCNEEMGGMKGGAIGGSIGRALMPCPSATTTIEDRVLSTNPILEAFGNAQTTRNDNSSRFGKYIQIFFNRRNEMIGAALRTYLLEKTRVVFQASEERNFHIFYQLCAGLDPILRQQLGLTSKQYHFEYLKGRGETSKEMGHDERETMSNGIGKTHDSKGAMMQNGKEATMQNGRGTAHLTNEEMNEQKEDAEAFAITREALSIAGFDAEEQMQIWKMLAAILHLGNVQICADTDDDDNRVGSLKENSPSKPPTHHQNGLSKACHHPSTSRQNMNARANLDPSDSSLLHACTLLDIPAEQTAHWLVKRKISAAHETIEADFSVAQAIAARDAMAKWLYAMLFDYIVDRLNESLVPIQGKTANFIGVLDIYGFERFEHNSFEQFCINYANEKLQQQFNQHVFKLEQELYQAENIQWSFINYHDNQPCIDLIEAKLGILTLLDEECRFPNGTDQTLVAKLYERLGKVSGPNCFLLRGKLDQADTFTVRHFAYDVTYTATGFLEKNRDHVPTELLDLLALSTHPIAKGMAKRLDREGGRPEMARSSTGKPSTGALFKTSLGSLMETMAATNMHYIRCIKPNETKEALLFDAPFVAQQLRACGIIETIRISGSGYPGRWSFDDFLARYRLLMSDPCMVAAMPNQREACVQLLEAIEMHPDQYQIGRSKVFMRVGMLASLEDARTGRLNHAGCKIQGGVRHLLARRTYVYARWCIGRMQISMRWAIAMRIVQALRRERAALWLQKAWRDKMARQVIVGARTLSRLLCVLWWRRQSTGDYQRRLSAKLANIIFSLWEALHQRRHFLRMVKANDLLLRQWRADRAKHLIRRLRAKWQLEDRPRIEEEMSRSMALETKIVELSRALQNAELERNQLSNDLSSLQSTLKRTRASSQNESQQVTALQEANTRLREEIDQREKILCERNEQLHQKDTHIKELEERIHSLEEIVEELEKAKEELVRKSEQLLSTTTAMVNNQSSIKKVLLRPQNGHSIKTSPNGSSMISPSPSSSPGRPPLQRAPSMANIVERGGIGHRRTMSIESKLDMLKQLPNLHNYMCRPLAFTLASEEELRVALENEAIMQELLQQVVDNAAIPTNRRMSLGETSMCLVRMPTQIFQSWISAWLELESQPQQLRTQLVAVLARIKQNCISALNDNDGRGDGHARTPTDPIPSANSDLHPAPSGKPHDRLLAFWIANLFDLLCFLQGVIARLSESEGGFLGMEGEQQFSNKLLVVLQLRTDAIRTIEELYRTWLAELFRHFAHMGISALLDFQGLTGFASDTNGTASRSVKMLIFPFARFAGNSAIKELERVPVSVEFLVEELDELADALEAANLQAEVATQLFQHILTQSASAAFNQILLRKNYASWKRGIQIQYNISRLEEWASILNMRRPGYFFPPGTGLAGRRQAIDNTPSTNGNPTIIATSCLPQFEPLIQAVKLLQLAKTRIAADLDLLMETCPRLNLVQIRKILSLYVPDVYEDGPVAPEILRDLTIRIQHRQIENRGMPPILESLPELLPQAVPLQLSLMPTEHLHDTPKLPAAFVPPHLWKLFALVAANKTRTRMSLSPE